MVRTAIPPDTREGDAPGPHRATPAPSASGPAATGSAGGAGRPPSAEALLPEAHQRRRRRWLRGMAALAAGLGVAAVLVWALGPPSGHRRDVANDHAPHAATAVRACLPSQLDVASDPAGWHANRAAGGQFAETFTVTDVSASACTLSGWPSVQAESGGVARSTTVVRVSQDSTPARAYGRVQLAPGGVASFEIYGADWDAARNTACPEAAGYLVTLPGTSEGLRVGAVEPDCGKVFVAPIVPGRVDNYGWTVVVGSGSPSAPGGAQPSAG